MSDSRTCTGQFDRAFSCGKTCCKTPYGRECLPECLSCRNVFAGISAEQSVSFTLSAFPFEAEREDRDGVDDAFRDGHGGGTFPISLLFVQAEEYGGQSGKYRFQPERERMPL